MGGLGGTWSAVHLRRRIPEVHGSWGPRAAGDWWRRGRGPVGGPSYPGFPSVKYSGFTRRRSATRGHHPATAMACNLLMVVGAFFFCPRSWAVGGRLGLARSPLSGARLVGWGCPRRAGELRFTSWGYRDRSHAGACRPGWRTPKAVDRSVGQSSSTRGFLADDLLSLSGCIPWDPRCFVGRRSRFGC